MVHPYNRCPASLGIFFMLPMYAYVCLPENGPLMGNSVLLKILNWGLVSHCWIGPAWSIRATKCRFTWIWAFGAHRNARRGKHISFSQGCLILNAKQTDVQKYDIVYAQFFLELMRFPRRHFLEEPIITNYSVIKCRFFYNF